MHTVDLVYNVPKNNKPKCYRKTFSISEFCFPCLLAWRCTLLHRLMLLAVGFAKSYFKFELPPKGLTKQTKFIQVIIDKKKRDSLHCCCMLTLQEKATNSDLPLVYSFHQIIVAQMTNYFRLKLSLIPKAHQQSKRFTCFFRGGGGWFATVKL